MLRRTLLRSPRPHRRVRWRVLADGHPRLVGPFEDRPWRTFSRVGSSTVDADRRVARL